MIDRFYEIAQYYDGLVDRFGHHHRACDYGRAESQAVKFRTFAESVDFTGLSVLDVGCGFADFGVYLQDRFAGVRYTGIDLSPRMIEEARRFRPDLDLRVGNLMDPAVDRPFDVVTANGIFYLLGADAPELMKKLVGKMSVLARRAVLFNTLSSWAPDQVAGEFYADPTQVLEWCRTLSSRLVLRHDYHSRDFTICIYKDKQDRARLRLVEAEDIGQLFEWRNDPWIVSLGTSRREVTWEEHSAWLSRVLKQDRHLLFIVYSCEGVPAGTVRLDVQDPGAAILTIYLLKAFTGRGLGPWAVGEACWMALARWSRLERITAFVRRDNLPSIKCFARAGFHEDSDSPGCPDLHVAMAWTREPS
jgi:RimJ/RimL family protein N-acetyltransferase